MSKGERFLALVLSLLLGCFLISIGFSFFLIICTSLFFPDQVQWSNPHVQSANPHVQSAKSTFSLGKDPTFLRLGEAMAALEAAKVNSVQRICSASVGKVAKLIKAVGFFNVKAARARMHPGGSRVWKIQLMTWMVCRLDLGFNYGTIMNDPTFYDRTMENGDLCPKIRGLGVNIQLITWMGWMGLGFKWIYQQEK